MRFLLLLQDITKLIEGIQKLAELLGVNPKLLRYVWWAVVIVFLVWLLTWLKNLLWENYIKQRRLTPEEKRRLARRQIFADVIKERIQNINSEEEWRDTRFAELEAEVEAEGERRMFSLNPFRRRTRSGLRREKSLTKAIEMSRERLVQLEGEPGSGKSVALRYVARTLSERASKSRDLKSVIPLYLNLKELNRGQEEAVDRNLTERFVNESLTKRKINRDIEEYLEDEFKRGMVEGTWLFLFDSFDEIPEILSSIEADATIRNYADAISDFLTGMNRCHGVVASRYFRGPGQTRWPRFRILPLSESRRLKLIKQALLPPEIERQLTGHLEASPEIRDMSANPMLLGLLSEYMKASNPFPDNVHTVLSSYLEHRLSRDDERVKRRYGVGTDAVRAAAESAAFCMAADVGLGLNPAREDLKRAMGQQGFSFGDDIDALLDALVFIKLARAEESAAGDAKSFTFAHRRFQEYFATRVVLREPDRVSPQALLSDARWRETAVVMCQSQPPEVLGLIIEEARRALAELADGLTINLGQPDGAALATAVAGQADDVQLPDSFTWPHGMLHLLSLLQDGFSRRLNDLPDDVRGRIGEMLLAVNQRAGRFDRKCALEVAGATPGPVLLRLLRDAFTSDSQLLKNIAYRQVARLGEIPDDIAGSIRAALLSLVGGGRLWRERLATSAHLARLDKPERFTSSLRLLLALPHVDLFLHVLVLLESLAYLMLAGANRLPKTDLTSLGALIFLSLLASHASFRLIRVVRALAGKGVDVILIAYLRIGVAMEVIIIPLAAINGADTRPSWKWLHIALCAYMTLWLPSSLIAARAGQCASIIWWPLMPLVPPLLLLRNMSYILGSARKNWRGVGRFTLMLLLYVAFLRTFFEYKLIFFPVTVFFMLVGTATIFVVTYMWLRDKLRWHMRAKAYLTPMTGQFFFDELHKYKTAPFRQRFVSAVRSRGLLEATRQTDEMIEGLALSIERDVIRRKRRRRFRNLSNTAEVLRGKPLPTAELIDELTLLLEQVRANRRDGAPQGQATVTAPAATGGGVQV
jgi:NACHT domain